MGEILSTIARWIEARCERATTQLHEAWEAVKSLIDGMKDVVNHVVRVVSSFSYTREKQYYQSESTDAGGNTKKTRSEVCLPLLNSQSILLYYLRNYLLISAVYIIVYTTDKPAHSSV